MDRIRAIEDKINRLCDDNKENPEIYGLLQELSSCILNIDGYYNEAPDLSYDIATDLFMKLCNDENFRVVSWIKYIKRSIPGYLHKYKVQFEPKYNEKMVLVDPTDRYEFHNNNYNGKINRSQSNINNIVSVFPKIVVNFYNKVTRYQENSELYYNTLVSLLLTISNHKYCIYKDTNYTYLIFLYKLFRNDVIKILRSELKSLGIVYNTSDLKLVKLSIGEINESVKYNEPI